MLSCGVAYSPLEVQRVTRTFTSSSRPARVLTDAGPGFVKGLRSPAGDGSLAAELMAAELATLMGLSVPPFAVIFDPKLDVPMTDWRVPVMDPPLFCSKEVEGTPSDGTDVFLSRLDRPEDLAKLVIFDTWVRNVDRWAPDGHGEPNRDNLLFGAVGRGVYRAYPIDHASCFVVGTFEELDAEGPLVDEEVYGLFPEFRPYLTPNLVASAVETMLAITANDVREIVNSVPAQWGMTAHVRGKLCDLITQRAHRVADFAPPLLVDQPMMHLPEGGK
jgi:hypothetical protein